MKTEFRKAELPRELRSLAIFDRKVFPSDYFPPSYWNACEAYWLLVEDRKIGCCAFEEHVDFPGDTPMQGSLFISTTGILPPFQGVGFGRMMKAWQIAYARYRGFTRIVTNTRKRNRAMIALNESFGFQVIRTISRYYANPTGATVVMELLLR